MATTTALPQNMRGRLLAPPPTTKAARKKWLIARRQVLGASDVAVILGMAPSSWQNTPLSIWLEKTDPDHVPEDPSERMLWGLRLERPLVDEYRVRHAKAAGVYVAPSPGLLQSEDHPWLSATPDRILVDRRTRSIMMGLLEAKTADKYLEREWADGVPLYYQIQTQVQMLVTGAPWVDVVPLFGGNKMPEPYRVYRDREAIAQIIDLTGAWWRAHVEAGVPPEPDVNDMTRLPQVWPGDDSAIDLPESLVGRLLVRERIKARIKMLEKAAARVELDLKTTMRDATTAWWQPPKSPDALAAPAPVKVATWSRYPVRQFDRDSFRADHPDLDEKYTDVTTGQRLTVHKQIHDTTTTEE